MIVDLNVPKIGLAEMVRHVCPQTLIIEPKYPKTELEKRVEFQEGYQFNAVDEFQRYYLHSQGIEVPTAVLEVFEQLHQEMSDAIA